MKTAVTLLLLIFSQLYAQSYTIVIHGGAGNGITEANIPPARQQEYFTVMDQALKAGAEILDNNGSAVEAVVTVISILENSPLFNAGKGSVFTYDERNEMDASIMEGFSLNAGAVCGVTTIKNPITAAMAVMNNSPHVLLSGKGAEDFARVNKLEMVKPEYFQTPERLKSLERFKKSQGSLDSWEDIKMGTVGCVVRDKNGNLAAGTSTGGMTGKRYGRIGDSPIIGAGTYANNKSCAISCTGHGEYFIRYAVAHDVSARMLHGNQSLAEAAGELIKEVLAEAGGQGGLIGIDAAGNISMPFNTEGMFRAYLREGETPEMFMFHE